MTATVEKRGAARARHDSVAELLDADDRPLPGTVRLVDVSPAGARFSSAESFALGQRLRARIRTLRDGVRDVHGVIVWSMTRGNANVYGVRFGARAGAR